MTAAGHRLRLPLAMLLLGVLPVYGAVPVPPKQGAGVIVNGAHGLPDLDRGRQAADQGRTEDAERDLLPLAERGYPEAQYALAKLYGRLGTAGDDRKAIRWYRAVLRRMPEVAVPLARLLLHDPTPAARIEAEKLFSEAWSQRGEVDALAELIKLYTDDPTLDRTNRLPGYAAKAERLDRAETNLALIRWYRATPELKDHPARLLGLCRKALDLDARCYVDLAAAARSHGDHAAVKTLAAAVASQLGAGRIAPEIAESFARTLVANIAGTLDNSPEPATSDLPEDDNPPAAPIPVSVPGGSCAQPPVGVGARAAAAKAAAKAPAAAGNSEPELAAAIVRQLLAGPIRAQVLGAGVVIRYPWLLPDFELEPVLLEGRKQGIAEASLYLGELYLAGERSARNPVAAQAALEAAANNPDTRVAAEFYLGRLYQSGYLDEVDAARARDYLLEAARAGYLSADAALARLYSAGRGVCANHRYAYVFARIGAQAGAPSIRILLGELQQAMTPGEIRDAETLLRAELAARSTRAGGAS